MIARGWKWIAAMLLVAAVVHGATVLLLPRLIMLRTMNGITKTAGASNAILHGPRATWRNDPIEAEPHCGRISVEGEFHNLLGQRLDPAVEQSLGGARSVVPASPRLARRVARLSLRKPALRGAVDLNLQVRFRCGRIFSDKLYHDVFS